MPWLAYAHGMVVWSVDKGSSEAQITAELCLRLPRGSSPQGGHGDQTFKIPTLNLLCTYFLFFSSFPLRTSRVTFNTSSKQPCSPSLGPLASPPPGPTTTPHMDFLKSAVASAIAKGSSFPFSLGDRVDIGDSIWTLHNGTKRVRGSTPPVVVWCLIPV